MRGIEKWVLVVVGVVGGLWSMAINGLGLAVVTLAIFMAIDYVSGIMQGIYNRNINSEIGYRGLVRKVYYLLLVWACYLLEDLLFSTRHLADGITISFVVMEFISITENGVRMNAPFSSVFRSFLALVKKGVDEE